MNIKQALDAYAAKFGEGYPTLIMRQSEEETIKSIEHCIEENKTAEELFDIDLDIDYEY